MSKTLTDRDLFSRYCKDCAHYANYRLCTQYGKLAEKYVNNKDNDCDGFIPTVKVEHKK